MKFSVCVLCFLMTALFISCAEPGYKDNIQTFGAEITMTESVTLARIYSNPEKFNGQEILVTGKIIQVCQNRGCWLKMTDGNNELTVRFKDYAFFVPKNASGSMVKVQGIFTAGSDEHIEQEASEQAAVTTNVLSEKPASYTLTASAVEISDPSLKGSG